MVKITLNWGDEYPMDEFNVTYSIARSVFTMLSRISGTWVKWTSLKHSRKEVYLCDPEKNTSCRKGGCQTYCYFCTNPEYSKDGYKLCYNGSGFDVSVPEEVDCETGKPPEFAKGLNEINKITEFRKDEENKTPEL